MATRTPKAIIKEYYKGGGAGAVYCLGLIGTVIFYWQRADSFWSVILGALKALIWPAILVYQLLGLVSSV